MLLQFESITASQDYLEFDCGNEELNKFLAKRAQTEEAQRLSKTKIVTNENGEIVGFYTIAPAVIAKESLEKNDAREVSYAEVPAIRIGRLAIDKKYHRMGP
jgi:hypothetical protein